MLFYAELHPFKHLLKAKFELLTGGATLYDEFAEYVINRRCENKTALQYAKIMEIGSARCFKEVRRCEPSNVMTLFFGPPCRPMQIKKREVTTIKANK